jgi:hypothetical protein
MGKGGIADENEAAWLHGINNIKIEPFKLLPLGTKNPLRRPSAHHLIDSTVECIAFVNCTFVEYRLLFL